MNDLTEWYEDWQKPVRPGPYITYWGGGRAGYSYWDGEMWSVQFSTVEKLMQILELSYPLAVQKKRWRGLAYNPYA